MTLTFGSRSETEKGALLLCFHMVADRWERLFDQKVGSNLSSRVLCLDKVFLDRTIVDMVLLLVCHLDGIRICQQ